ncbi:DUF2934 domain-containing protein [Azotobacter salinestris]|uniref:DUF2934 domain-containing protein n=1 Tax=Azotobacter salinestris TaxID=69964 RepID=UPI0032DF08AB
MSLDEERIRERAYRLWEAEGCPEGQEMKHWREACEQIQAEDDIDASSDTLEIASGGVESSIEPPMPSKQSAT